MIRFHRHLLGTSWLWISLGCTISASLDPTASAAPPARRARPPQFSQRDSDAFFADAQKELVGPRPTKTSPANAAATDTAPAEASAAAVPTAAGWSKLVSAETIEDEIKSQQRQLRDAVRNPASFKGGGYQRARNHLSLLAVLFAIDASFDEKVRWQHEAPAVRDFLARAGLNCKVGTDASYREAKTCADELENLVRGGSAQLPAASSEKPWAKIADRAPLMKRLEQAQQQALAPWTADADEFSRRADRLSHEAQIVAALARVIQHEQFEFADDETYRAYASAMQSGALAIRQAIEQKDYMKARLAVGEVGKSCTHCHEGYRN